MKVSLCLLLLFVCNIACQDEDEDDEARRREIVDQLTKTRTVILNDYRLVTRQVATDVFRFRNYRTVSVVFYPVQRDVTEARFIFQAEELHLNNIGSCGPEEVIINLKHGSYPALNPDGYPFPEHFVDPDLRSPIHKVELLSDGENASYIIKNPKPGFWYALAYRPWQDPRTQKVKQQGLVPNCRTILYTDLQVKVEEKITQISCGLGLTVQESGIPAIFKCITVDDTQPIGFNLSVISPSENDTRVITVLIQALTLPTAEDNLIACYFDPRSTSSLTINFTPHSNAWHYIKLDYTEQNSIRHNPCDDYSFRAEDVDYENEIGLGLMRDTKGRFFAFDYGLPTTDIHDSVSLLNLTSDEIKTVSFKINQLLDIGGTLSIEASLIMSLKYYMGYKRSPVSRSQFEFTDENQFVRVVICLDNGHTSVPQPSGECLYNNKLSRALFVFNSSDSQSISDKVLIPYPETGTWYISLRLFCDSVVCPCPSTENGTKYLVNTSPYATDDPNNNGSTVNTSPGAEDLESGNETRLGTTKCNASVVLSISSNACVFGRCSKHGNCLINTFGGLIMSFCNCVAGYGGWDCSDDSRMDTWLYMLATLLLLTLSNLLFLFSIYIAIIRLYHTEAVMYSFTMVFSTFYHACDAPWKVAFCITKRHILQYGDFYCGIMCFWVTLLAMSIMKEKLRSSLQLIGAIVVALLTTWNMHSIVAFMLPVALGVTILLLSWGITWYKTHSLMYRRSYFTIFFPIGFILVGIGLICYAFLQTEENYRIVHSFWHMIIALSVVFLLPDCKRDPDANPFLPTSNFCFIPFRKVRNPIPPIESR